MESLSGVHLIKDTLILSKGKLDDRDKNGNHGSSAVIYTNQLFCIIQKTMTSISGYTSKAGMLTVKVRMRSNCLLCL